MDAAARAAARADRSLAALRTELADVPSALSTGVDLGMTDLTRFADVWFDNVFTDARVHDRIRAARQQVGARRVAVVAVLRSLDGRLAALRAGQAAGEAERRGLIAAGAP